MAHPTDPIPPIPDEFKTPVPSPPPVELVLRLADEATAAWVLQRIGVAMEQGWREAKVIDQVPPSPGLDLVRQMIDSHDYDDRSGPSTLRSLLALVLGPHDYQHGEPAMHECALCRGGWYDEVHMALARGGP